MADTSVPRLLLLTGGLLAATIALGLAWLGQVLPPSVWLAALLGPDGLDIRQVLVHDSFLPRAAAALLCGAALSLAGCLLQQVLRNPLAEPGTLAIASGAHLSLALASLFAPWLLAFGREWAALAGGALAMAGVLALSWRSGLAPVPVVLAGLVVGLYCSALGTVLMLFNEHDLAGLFIWGSGSLSLQDWAPVERLLPPIAAAILASALLARPLGLMDLGDSGARSLGLPLHALRAAALAVAVGLTAVVVSGFGVIGFVGLAGPTLARMAGARRPAERLVWGGLVGAALLSTTDMLVQLVPAGGGMVPTGAVTALLGAPILLGLLPRLSNGGTPPPAPAQPSAPPARHPGRVLGLLAGLSIGFFAIAIVCGRTSAGWTLSLGADLDSLLPWRAPRVIGAGAAGAMLATAGALLQRLTGNAMASPELLGISAGAVLGSAAALFLGAASSLGQTGAAAVGAMVVLAGLLLVVRRTGFLSERILIAGLALTAFLDAIIAGLTATGDPRAMLLLNWMTGSTYRMDAAAAAWSCGAAALLVPAALACARWLDILPLGAAFGRSLGIPLGRAQLILLALASGLTAAGTLVIGPLSFVGLMAPHLAARAGLNRALPHLAGSALVGAAIMVLADWLGRMVDFPWQIPAGLVATLVGGPALMGLVARPRR